MHPLPATMQQKVLLLLLLRLLPLRMLLLSVGEAGHHVPPCMSRPGSGQLAHMVTERVAFRAAGPAIIAARPRAGGTQLDSGVFGCTRLAWLLTGESAFTDG